MPAPTRPIMYVAILAQQKTIHIVMAVKYTYMYVAILAQQKTIHIVTERPDHR
jgi:hypothetical protein